MRVHQQIRILAGPAQERNRGRVHDLLVGVEPHCEVEVIVHIDPVPKYEITVDGCIGVTIEDHCRNHSIVLRVVDQKGADEGA